MSRFEGAIEDCDRVISLGGKDFMAISLKAFSLVESGKSDEAMNMMYAELDSNPYSKELLVVSTCIYYSCTVKYTISGPDLLFEFDWPGSGIPEDSAL